jgi:anti-sigma B factor antagonist
MLTRGVDGTDGRYEGAQHGGPPESSPCDHADLDGQRPGAGGPVEFANAGPDCFWIIAVNECPAEGVLSDRTGGSVVRLAARGELDLATAHHLATTLAAQLAEGRRTVCLDLSGLTFCGVSGLSALLQAHRSYEEAGSVLILTGCDRQLRRHLQLTGLDGILHVIHTPVMRQDPGNVINSSTAC